MSSKEWKYIAASTFCYKIADGTHDSPKRQEKGKKLITSKHIKERVIDFDSAYHITIEDYTKINLRSKVDQWDVLISMIGEYCGYCYVERNKIIDYAVKNVGIFKTGSKLKAEWLYYYLNSGEGRSILSSLRSGTSQPYISLGALRNLPIMIPAEESTMSGIVNILSSLDDKIELNRQTNQTLEGIAQTLFQEMCLPKGEELPEGWRVGKLGEIMESKGGTTPSTKNEEFWNGEYNWVTPKDLSNKIFPVLLSSERTITEKGLKQISSGLLPKGTLLMSSRAPIGYFAISQIPVAINQGFIAINGKSVSNLFLLYYLRSNIETIKGMANGSTFLEISKSVFRGIEIVIPPNSVLEKFDFQVKPIFEQIVSNEQETQTLIALRNSLLPKLMTGEIEI
ncbi:MAG: restriction endonuclease subunit S [Paludibacter sp.]|nr:restriction endonuclease subunit S [Paludibacter sp.]